MSHPLHFLTKELLVPGRVEVSAVFEGWSDQCVWQASPPNQNSRTLKVPWNQSKDKRLCNHIREEVNFLDNYDTIGWAMAVLLRFCALKVGEWGFLVSTTHRHGTKRNGGRPDRPYP
jgi:hypothetical protein